jgi:AcrR family transcriptional regulator
VADAEKQRADEQQDKDHDERDETLDPSGHGRRLFGHGHLRYMLSQTATMRIIAIVPKLWESTIETHRRAVQDAALDAVGALVSEHGLRGVTMSAIAQRTGIGRATLYRYFADVDAVLAAWHERHISAHIEHLAGLKTEGGTALERLERVLAAYAQLQYEQPRDEIAASLHARSHVDHARDRLEGVVADLIAEAAEAGAVRRDVSAGELARFCLHALTASAGMRSGAAVQRLVDVTMTGLRFASQTA